ncbi:TonB-dependent receptor [Reichenbachiella carrageenanivorans]|uniref:TonB-dependent receptor n=1 Tax=Reichenbachiella carrageenanivorans TaxID=2979869 RepID=A0ABY6D645_9BACT|nr:TonB-dependent receptor [Reichenbachiella carrageenanivorans]UXX81075.1 TonB-dependent receptor [Reichenbachiella carrageenanivorans]
MKRLKYILIICLSTALAAHAQEVKIISNDEPVSHATIQVTDLNQTATAYYISDETGTVSIAQTPPYIATISHLNFKTKTDTIHHSSKQQWQLFSKENTLNEIVVTGQYQAQSVKQSVYQVNVLDEARIQAQGAQSLTEVLASELNIRFSRDNATGSSSVSLQGLSGQNVKVLLDGVPLVGRSGVSNEIDLNQININTIERIEIIEGPMAVNYGADALAGVINVITKTNRHQKWNLNMGIQEETVGKEFSVFDQGIHNGYLSGSYRLNSHWSAQADTRIHRFGGWGGTGRDRLWYPKNQFFQSGQIHYDSERFSIYYRLDYLNETIENQGAPEQISPQSDPYAFDKEYLTDRWIHQVQSELSLGKGAMHTVISYTDYNRQTHRFKYFLLDGVPNITTTDGQDTIAFQTTFFRNTLDDVVQWHLGNTTWHTQLGIDGTFESAQGTTLSSGDKHMTDLGLFASTEISMGDKLKIRPGIRLTYNSIFNANPSASINLKYNFSPHSQLRLSYGRGFRAPSLRELYHEFIDANHNIVGNDELEPEYSNNINGDLTHQFKDTKWSFKVSSFYNDVHNRISYFTPEGTNQTTTYTNILEYKTLGTAGQVTYQSKKLTLKAGLSYIGRYHNLSEDASAQNIPQFLYSPEWITQLGYDLFDTGIRLSAFYKWVGANKQYLSIEDDNGNSNPEIRQLNDYHLLDLSLSKTWKDVLTVGMGAKNVMDLTTINNNISTGGAHSSNSDGRSSVAYGRSFFMKISYQFIKN